MRLIKAELHKCLDTRSAKAVLVAIVLFTLMMIALTFTFFSDHLSSWADIFKIVINPATTILGVLFLNLVTQEWSHGIGLLTFSIERKRQKVIVAKFAATFLIALTVLIALFIISFGVTFVHNLMFEQEITYAFSGSELFDTLRVFATNILLAFVFGLALRNAGLAIVLYFIIPPITIILGQLPQIGEYTSWLSLGHSSSLFIAGYQAQETVQICLSTLLWITVPLLIGLYLNSKDYQER